MCCDFVSNQAGYALNGFQTVDFKHVGDHRLMFITYNSLTIQTELDTTQRAVYTGPC